MAGLLTTDTSAEPGLLRRLLLSAAVLAVVLGAAFALFYHHADHAPVEVTPLRSLMVPLHTVYTHTGKVVGADTAEDSMYVLAAVRVQDRTDVPLFVKDLRAELTMADGTPVEATRVKASDMDRVLGLVPSLQPAVRQIAVPPLQPEQTIAPHASTDGYVLLQINGPATVWTARKSATLTLDFYHQDSTTVVLR